MSRKANKTNCRNNAKSNAQEQKESKSSSIKAESKRN